MKLDRFAILLCSFCVVKSLRFLEEILRGLLLGTLSDDHFRGFVGNGLWRVPGKCSGILKRFLRDYLRNLEESRDNPQGSHK